MSKNILFRADSSSTIGLGHIMRDLVFAQRYKEYNITFACQNLDGNINKKIKEAGFSLEILKSNNPNELIDLLLRLNINILIIDHYGIDYKFEKIIKEKTQVKLLVFDDTYEKHFCDEIINHNISADASKYRTEEFTKVCIIPPLIRDEFKKITLRNTEVRTGNILICMGGVDSKNLTPSIISILKNFKNIHIHVATSNINKYIHELKSISDITLHINTVNMAKLMNQSDLAIITPSVIVHEAMFMNLPFIAIKIASNQDDIYQYLQKHGFNVLEQFNEKYLLDYLEKELS